MVTANRSLRQATTSAADASRKPSRSPVDDVVECERPQRRRRPKPSESALHEQKKCSSRPKWPDASSQTSSRPEPRARESASASSSAPLLLPCGEPSRCGSCELRRAPRRPSRPKGGDPRLRTVVADHSSASRQASAPLWFGFSASSSGWPYFSQASISAPRRRRSPLGGERGEPREFRGRMPPSAEPRMVIVDVSSQQEASVGLSLWQDRIRG